MKKKLKLADIVKSAHEAGAEVTVSLMPRTNSYYQLPAQTAPLFTDGEFAIHGTSSPLVRITGRCWPENLARWRYAIQFITPDESYPVGWRGGGGCFWCDESEFQKVIDPVMKIKIAIWEARERIAAAEKNVENDKALILSMKTTLTAIGKPLE